MNQKIISLALGACLLLASVHAFAALNEAEKMYVDRLHQGRLGIAARRGARASTTPATPTPRCSTCRRGAAREVSACSGEDRDAVDAVAWLCRALGSSGNGRYRAVLEHVENDKSVHRKARGHCEKAAKALPKGAAQLVRRRHRESRVAAQSAAAAAAARARRRQGQEGRESRPPRSGRGCRAAAAPAPRRSRTAPRRRSTST